MTFTFDKYKTFYYFKKENDTIPIVFIHGIGFGSHDFCATMSTANAQK